MLVVHETSKTTELKLVHSLVGSITIIMITIIIINTLIITIIVIVVIIIFNVIPTPQPLNPQNQSHLTSFVGIYFLAIFDIFCITKIIYRRG